MFWHSTTPHAPIFQLQSLPPFQSSFVTFHTHPCHPHLPHQFPTLHHPSAPLPLNPGILTPLYLLPITFQQPPGILHVSLTLAIKHHQTLEYAALHLQPLCSHLLSWPFMDMYSSPHFEAISSPHFEAPQVLISGQIKSFQGNPLSVLVSNVPGNIRFCKFEPISNFQVCTSN